MNTTITTIGFDADDTLWHNEQFFRVTQDRFASLLSDYTAQDHLMERLLAAERRNLGQYGYGIKGFVLSMIETAIEVTDGKVSAKVIKELIDAGQDMLQHPIELLPHAQTTIENLAGQYHILLITKGDLLDQERKLAQSGLGDLFDGVEIVSEKTTASYLDIFKRHDTNPETAMMIGNSVKSDVVPVLNSGGWGVHVPHGLTWELEYHELPEDHPRFRQATDLGQIEKIISDISQN